MELGCSYLSGSQASQPFPEITSPWVLCVLSRQGALCVLLRASRSYAYLFKQDTTPKSAPVLARGNVTRTCSPETVYALISPWSHHWSPWCRLAQGSWEDSWEVHESASHAQSRAQWRKLNWLFIRNQSKDLDAWQAGRWLGRAFHFRMLSCAVCETRYMVLMALESQHFADLSCKTMYPEGRALHCHITAVL